MADILYSWLLCCTRISSKIKLKISSRATKLCFVAMYLAQMSYRLMIGWKACAFSHSFCELLAHLAVGTVKPFVSMFIGILIRLAHERDMLFGHCSVLVILVKYSE
jgi:hypothetical protein